MSQAAQCGRFELPGAVWFEDGPGGLTRAVISTPSAEAQVYLQGAHVTNWSPRGQKPVLFTSSKSLFEPGKAIRGGVPIIFPWFGPRRFGQPGPAHGFARTMTWQIEATRIRPDGNAEIRLTLDPNDATRALGYSAFQLRLRLTVGSELHMELEVRNDSSAPLVFEEALHTYLAIADIRQALVSGLEGTLYIDKTDGFQRKTLNDGPLQIGKETDQVHLNTKSPCVVHDPVWDRRIVVEKSGSESTVVWNPWIGKAEAMSDMGPGEWQQMICVESANAADNAVPLAPAAVHKMTASIRVE